MNVYRNRLKIKIFVTCVMNTPTMMSIHNGLDVMNTHFSFVFASFSMYGQVRVNLPACIMRVMRLSDIPPQHLDGYLPCNSSAEHIPAARYTRQTSKR